VAARELTPHPPAGKQIFSEGGIGLQARQRQGSSSGNIDGGWTTNVKTPLGEANLRARSAFKGFKACRAGKYRPKGRAR